MMIEATGVLRRSSRYGKSMTRRQDKSISSRRLGLLEISKLVLLSMRKRCTRLVILFEFLIFFNVNYLNLRSLLSHIFFKRKLIEVCVYITAKIARIFVLSNSYIIS